MIVCETNLRILSTIDDDDEGYPDLIGICRGEYKGCETTSVGWGEDLNEALKELIELEKK